MTGLEMNDINDGDRQRPAPTQASRCPACGGGGGQQYGHYGDISEVLFLSPHAHWSAEALSSEAGFQHFISEILTFFLNIFVTLLLIIYFQALHIIL